MCTNGRKFELRVRVQGVLIGVQGFGFLPGFKPPEVVLRGLEGAEVTRQLAYDIRAAVVALHTDRL